MNFDCGINRFVVGDLVKMIGDPDSFMGLVTRAFIVKQDTVFPLTGTKALPVVNIAWVDNRQVSLASPAGGWFYYEKLLELVKRAKEA